MNILIFGATGMVGQGVLRECLLSTEITPVQQQHSKLRNVVHKDMWDYTAIEDKLTGFDACFFCLGVSSAGLSEDDYRHMTCDLTLSAAETLARLNPQMVFIYVSGAGTDSSEHGRLMWARIKGKTENALLRLPFKAAYMFRPGAIEPLHGIRSKTAAYRIGYIFLKPVLPLLRWIFPDSMLTTEAIGRAMLAVVRRGAPKRILESKDINAIARGA